MALLQRAGLALRRPRRHRLRPRPGRLHRPAHRVRRRAGPGLRPGPAGGAGRQPGDRRRGRRAPARGSTPARSSGSRWTRAWTRSTPAATATTATAGWRPVVEPCADHAGGPARAAGATRRPRSSPARRWRPSAIACRPAPRGACPTKPAAPRRWAGWPPPAWRAATACRPTRRLPVYLRDKVAQTTAEREAAKAAARRRRGRRDERRALRDSAPPPAAQPPSLRVMTVDQLDAVLAIEVQAYAFPWTRGNFIDSLAAGYLARALVGRRRRADRLLRRDAGLRGDAPAQPDRVAARTRAAATRAACSPSSTR